MIGATTMTANHLHATGVAILLGLAAVSGQEPATVITKWQDGKRATISLTFDDRPSISSASPFLC
jgi:hypothetical protein